METKILKGLPVRKEWQEKLKKEIKKRAGISLHVVLLGDDPASISYVKSKQKRAKSLDVEFVLHELPYETSKADLLSLLDTLNKDPAVTGIMIEFPLPEHLDAEEILQHLSPLKDVDCLTSVNQGLLFRGDMTITPSTPRAALELALFYGYKPEDMNVAVIGRSNVVGMPLVRMLLSRESYGNATVTVCHSKTKDLKEVLKNKNLIFVAAGVPKLLKKDYIKPGSVIIDIGVNMLDGKLVGDADYDDLLNYVEAITPVPGGVGPLTATFIFDNLIKLYDKQRK